MRILEACAVLQLHANFKQLVPLSAAGRLAHAGASQG
jgi:hypothetical protein